MFFRSPSWESVVYWALDLETGGLDARTDAVLAVGMVPIRGGVIHLADAYRSLVRPAEGSRIDPESVRAHQLVAGELEGAPGLGGVIAEIDRRIREGVLLVHNRSVDVRFLQRDFKRAKVSWPSPRVVDTVDLIVRSARLRDPQVTRDVLPLNLSAARREHGLPEYQKHDALTDALATAELFLVLRSVVGARTLWDLR